MKIALAVKGIYLPIILLSWAHMKIKSLLNTTFGVQCARTSACFAIGS